MSKAVLVEKESCLAPPFDGILYILFVISRETGAALSTRDRGVTHSCLTLSTGGFYMVIYA